MNTITALSLADIELDLPLRAVTDDLAGFANELSLKAGLERGYAAFAAKTFSLGEISSRSAGYADEVTRFLALAGTSNRHQVAYVFDVLIALSLLNTAATVTVALAPPRLPAGHSARRRVLDDIIVAVGGDQAFAALARRAFAYPGMDAAADAGVTFEAATVPALADVLDGKPAMLGLEQGLSLMSFLRNLAPAVTLPPSTGSLLMALRLTPLYRPGRLRCSARSRSLTVMQRCVSSSSSMAGATCSTTRSNSACRSLR